MGLDLDPGQRYSMVLTTQDGLGGLGTIWLGWFPNLGLSRPSVWDNYKYLIVNLGILDISHRIDLFPRVGPHDLGNQIDIAGGLLLCQGTLGRWLCERRNKN